jgi:peptidoglycan/LPS O-acetylase OafA/YrhL
MGSFILTLVTQTILYLNMIHIMFVSPKYNDFYLVAFPVWMFYFIFGMFAVYKKDLWEQILKNKMLALTIVWVGSLLLLILDSKYTLTYGSSIRPTVILYTIATYFFFYALAIRCSYIKGQWLTWLANQSFLIFLMHPLILSIMVSLAPQIGMPNLWSGNSGMVLIYLFTSVLTLLAAYLISLTPLALLVGAINY